MKTNFPNEFADHSGLEAINRRAGMKVVVWLFVSLATVIFGALAFWGF